MEDWSELNQGKCFITDLGSEQTKEVDGEMVTLGRYAIWSPIANTKNHCIVEISSDCAKLQKKYNVSDTMIYYLQKKEA